MSAFCRYIGIDYSGAETPESSLKGLRVYCAVGESAANEVPPPPSPRKYWTFDGWSIPAGKSAVVEAYPSLWKHAFPADDRTPDQHDAFTVASWLSEADRSGQLARYLQPNLTPPERTVAGVEGWILGVG
jgi:hypothetical protein